MNLQTLSQLMGGGPGSGCNPDVGKCGRPPGDKSGYKQGDKLRLTKQVKVKAYEKLQKQQTKGLRKTFKPGTKVTFIKDVPGSHGGMVVEFKNGIQYHVNPEQVTLHKAIDVPLTRRQMKEKAQQEQKMRRIAPMMVKQGKGEYMKYLHPDKREQVRKEMLPPIKGKDVKYSEYMPSGYRYTEFTAKGPEITERKGPGERQHYGRTQFRMGGELKNLEGRWAARYEFDTPNRDKGTTLLVFRDLGKKTMLVQEMNRDLHGFTANMHEFRFRNLGHGAGFLNERYGIKLKFPKGR